MNSAAVNILVCVPIFLLVMHLGAVLWTLGFVYVQLQWPCPVFQSDHISLHPHQKGLVIPSVPHPHQHLIFCIFWVSIILPQDTLGKNKGPYKSRYGEKLISGQVSQSAVEIRESPTWHNCRVTVPSSLSLIPREMVQS